MSAAGKKARGTVRGVKRIEYLAREFDGLVNRQRAFQFRALDILHDEVIRPDVVKPADMRMIQRRDRPRFAFKSLAEFGLRDLECNRAVEPRVAGLPHFAHPGRADRREEFITSEVLSGAHRGTWRHEFGSIHTSRKVAPNSPQVRNRFGGVCLRPPSALFSRLVPGDGIAPVCGLSPGGSLSGQGRSTESAGGRIMVMSTTPALVPVEAYLRLTGKPYCEYRDGEVFPKAMPGKFHSIIQRILMTLLQNQEVEAFPELTVRISPTGYLVPDVCVAGDFPGPYPTEPVLLCCELLSPEDRLGAMLGKCEEYHARGRSLLLGN